MYVLKIVPEWWNWQTRWTQNPFLATECEFESHLGHHFYCSAGNVVPTYAHFMIFVRIRCANLVCSNELSYHVYVKQSICSHLVWRRRAATWSSTIVAMAYQPYLCLTLCRVFLCRAKPRLHIPVALQHINDTRDEGKV